MDSTVFFAVLLAAVLHASWNAVVKNAADKYLSMTAVVLGHAPLAIVAAVVAPAPAVACWPYLAAGVVFHLGYQMFLLWSYRAGDLSQVYPIARGTAPIVTAAVSVLVLGERLSAFETVAVLLIAAGIMSLVFVRGADGLRNAHAARLALITSLFIAGYSLVDGLGARVAGTGVGFFGWLATINAVVFALVMRVARPGLLSRVWPEARAVMAVGGGASFLAYAIVVWAFTLAPIALVAALRETSIVFALLISVVVLKERLDLAKLVSTFVTTAGAILLRFAR